MAAPTIASGTGWTGETIPPPAVGTPSDPAYPYMPIAHWNVVPKQNIAGLFQVGVVAFHINGISSVKIAADQPQSGDPVTSPNPSDYDSWTDAVLELNPRTGTWEYTAIVDADAFDDGPIALRAVAIPDGPGTPRVLTFDYRFMASTSTPTQDLVLYNNPGPTVALTSGGDIAAAVATVGPGGTVTLAAGSYVLNGNNTLEDDTRWVNIIGAPGTVRADVTMTSSTGVFGRSMTHFKGITGADGVRWQQGQFQSNGLWLDDCSHEGGTVDHNQITWDQSGTSGVFVTDCDIVRCLQLMKPMLVRGTDVYRSYVDGMREPRCVIDCTIREVGVDLPGDTEAHPDIVQWYLTGQTQGVDNILIYRLKATDNLSWVQGLFGFPMVDGTAYWHNVAFVNVLLERNVNPTPYPWHQQASVDHLLQWHVTTDKIGTNLAGPYDLADFRACVWWDVAGGGFESAANQGYLHDCHYELSSGYGTNATTGDPLFTDRDNDDYRPGVGSPLLDRITRFVIDDADGTERAGTTSVGAYVGSDEEPGGDPQLPDVSLGERCLRTMTHFGQPWRAHPQAPTGTIEQADLWGTLALCPRDDQDVEVYSPGICIPAVQIWRAGVRAATVC